MTDNLDIPDIDLNSLPRLSSMDMQDYTLDLGSWSSLNGGFTFLNPPEEDDPRPEIKSEPSSHSSAEYDGFQSNSLVSKMDLQQVIPDPEIASMPNAVPSNKDFAGDYNFDVKVACSKAGTQKPQVTYSQKLNKAYINMGHTLPIDFSWLPMEAGLSVRATMLYSCPHEAPNLVKRCNNHKSNECLKEGNSSDHVLLCKSFGARYYGCLETNNHLNVIVPLGVAQTGDSSVRVLYEFACKHSCISGMNRRNVECVFTLESPDGQILGRRKIGIRVCSCPKRDMTKEEEHEENNLKGILGKRKIKPCQSNAAVEPPKRSKDKGPLDTTYYTLPPIMGRKHYATLVQLAFGILSGTMVRSSPEDREKLQACVAEYEKLMNECERKSDA